MECMDEILEYTIYSITCINERVKGIYVGSTKDFVDRQIKHKYALNNKNMNHLKVYRVINENGKWDNWEFTCLQIRNCTEIDAHALERKWYDKLNADLNTRRPYLSDKELLEYDRVYHIENKEKRLEQFKQYYLKNKEKLASRDAEKIYCNSCEVYHSKGYKARHNKSKLHLDNIAKITDE